MRKYFFYCLFFIYGSLLIAQPKINIPGFSIPDPANTYVIAIGNEDYQTYSDKYTENVMLAIYEAEMFCQLMEHVYGVPKFNISFYPDAISTKMKLAFTKVTALANKSGTNAQIIFYYTGRYETDKYGIQNYLIPTDQAQSSINQGVGLEYIYQKLGAAKTKNIWILLDACITGKDRVESLLFNGGNPMEVSNPKYQGRFNIVVAKSTDEVHYDQTVDVPVDQTPPPPATTADDTPPEIILTSPDSSGSLIVLDNRNVLLTGKVNDESGIYAVAVNGKEAHLQSDGSFQARVVLEIGKNNILIEAIDTRDNLAEQKLIIERLAPEKPEEKIPIEQNASQGTSDLEGKYFALIIGVNDYQDPVISDLAEPINDAQKLYDILTTQYLFEPNNTLFIKNPSREEIISSLDWLEKNVTPNDNVLVFYAGHGYWDKTVYKGYWFPADAKRTNTANWLRNTTITGYVSGINSKHTLIIADACFGGSIFLTKGAFDEDIISVNEVYNKPSRRAITSGNLEEVPDKSVFLYHLCKNLTENNDKLISAEELFQSVKPSVVNNSYIVPQYGEIKNSGDEGGSFVFIKR